MKTKLKCFFEGHDWVFIRRTDDWLRGGTYYYECSRCMMTKETKPYRGGEY